MLRFGYKNDKLAPRHLPQRPSTCSRVPRGLGYGVNVAGHLKEGKDTSIPTHLSKTNMFKISHLSDESPRVEVEPIPLSEALLLARDHKLCI